MSSNSPTKRTLGVCYYPEHWPETQWARDAAQMALAGLTWVRIGEFAWSRLEPSEGVFDWGWMDRAIEILGGAGLKVILGTPTATPPRWMLDKWPDMLGVDAQGNPRKFGSRRHYCFSHLNYRDECARISHMLGERYGKNQHIQAWQIDNEYGCHDTTLSYSASANVGFRLWLTQKYTTISLLNQAWGNVFWSMEYSDFCQIELPNLTVTEANPAHVMDFRRYSSEMVVEFNQVQLGVLRSHTQCALIHNYMGRITDFDHFDVGKNLDIAAWDSYPLGFLEDRSEQSEAWKNKFMRQGDPDFQAFHHDLYRAVGRGRWWVMEQQPGPVNWAPYNPAPMAGMVRLWTWEAFAHGAETVCYFRWRQVAFGQEQMHAGLMRRDGQAAAGLAEAALVAAEIDAMPEMDFLSAKIALVFDYASAWGWETQPQGQNFDYFSLVFDFYRALRKLGQSVEIVAASGLDLSAYDLVFAPGLMNVEDRFFDSLVGLAILGPRYNSKTVDMQIPQNLSPEISELDCVVEHVESLRPGSSIALKDGGAFEKWFEVLGGDGPVLETTLAGDAAIMGTDKVWYLAGWPDEVALGRIVQQACDTKNIKTNKLPNGVRMRDGQNHRYIFNYGPETESVFGQDIEPAGVLILPAV